MKLRLQKITICLTTAFFTQKLHRYLMFKNLVERVTETIRWTAHYSHWRVERGRWSQVFNHHLFFAPKECEEHGIAPKNTEVAAKFQTI